MITPQHLNRLLAGLVFLVSFLVYFSTVAPTVSFWDCGEFIATSYRLGVPHPPGAPLFLILGRFFSLLPIPGDIAYRVNMISPLASALAVMFLYLIIVQLVRYWRGQITTTEDKIIAFGGGVIGALVFAFTDSHWFNAVEAEVYAVSTLSTALVVWLVLHWAERAEEPGSERYILIIAYVLGLSTGVHLLNLLALPFMALIIYFRKRSFSWTSFTTLMGIVLAIFLIIYQGIIKGLPKIARDISEIMSTTVASTVIGATLVIVGLFLLGLFSAAGSISERHKNLIRLGVTSLLLILIGYSSYELIFIRSSQNPGIDENDPETVQAAISYLEREQYGDTDLFRGLTYNNSTGTVETKTLFPRRGSRQGNHIKNYRRYSSDFDYFWRYQVKKMYWRYFLWQFAGRGPSVETRVSGFGASPTEDGVDWFQFGLPLAFLLGLGGMYFHFQRDQNQALSILALFIMTGIAIVFYLNQPDPQPRERDYSYVGSFLAFAIWVGIGASAIFERVLTRLREKQFRIPAALGTGVVLLIMVPGIMLSKNYHTHDRTGNYLPWDYSYNILQTCEPNGIIFTNGDNDTFPLWYLQEVEGIRKDVMVANLSLLNTPWYIRQLRDSRPEGERFINLTDEQIIPKVELRRPPVPMKISDSLDKQFEVHGNFLIRSGDEPITEEFVLTFNDFPVGKESNKVIKELRQLGLKVVNSTRLEVGKAKVKGSDIINFDYEVVEYNIVPFSSGKNSGNIPVYLGTLPWQDTKVEIVVGDGSEKISWTLKPTFSGRQGIRVQDLMIVHILNECARQVDEEGNWKTPVYFASTVSPGNMVNLSRYLKMEGLAFRVSTKRGGGIDYDKVKKNLTTVIQDDWSRDYQVGYRYRNLDNPDVYFNETTDIKLTQNWRHSFLQLAEVEARKLSLTGLVDTLGVKENKHAQAAREYLDMMEKLMPEAVVPVMSPIMYDKIGEIYSTIEDDSLAIVAWVKAAVLLDKENKWYPLDPTRFYQAGELYLKLGQVDKAAGKYSAAIPLLRKRVRDNPNDQQAQSFLSTCRYRLNQIDEFLRESTPDS
ncbi:MAG: protein O-mannosyl-transferase family [Fidelibacterota bacterium]